MQVVKQVLSHPNSSCTLLEAALAAWQKLGDVVSKSGQLDVRHQHLLMPIVHMLNTNSNSDARQVCLLYPRHGKWPCPVDFCCACPHLGQRPVKHCFHNLLRQIMLGCQLIIDHVSSCLVSASHAYNIAMFCMICSVAVANGWRCSIAVHESLVVTPQLHLGKSVMQAALTAWQHMVQLAGAITNGESPGAKAAKWRVIAIYSLPVLLALAESVEVQVQVDHQHMHCTKL